MGVVAVPRGKRYISRIPGITWFLPENITDTILYSMKIIVPQKHRVSFHTAIPISLC